MSCLYCGCILPSDRALCGISKRYLVDICIVCSSKEESLSVKGGFYEK